MNDKIGEARHIKAVVWIVKYGAKQLMISIPEIKNRLHIYYQINKKYTSVYTYRYNTAKTGFITVKQATQNNPRIDTET